MTQRNHKKLIYLKQKKKKDKIGLKIIPYEFEIILRIYSDRRVIQEPGNINWKSQLSY